MFQHKRVKFVNNEISVMLAMYDKEKEKLLACITYFKEIRFKHFNKRVMSVTVAKNVFNGKN